MNKSLLMLVALSIREVTSFEPTISMQCKGEWEYRDRDGICRTCEKCPPGKQPHGLCAWGVRAIDFGCEVCPDGSFSLRNDYNICVQCRPCEEDWNSYVYQECSPTQNRVCGACFEGYFRPRKSDGSPDDECHPCSVAPKGTPECAAEPAKFPWKTVTIILTICLVTLFLGFSTWCCCWQRHKRKKSGGNKGPDECDLPSSLERINDSSAMESLLDVSPNSRSESEHVSSVDLSQRSLITSRPAKSLPGSHVCEAVGFKAEATRHMPSLQPQSGNPISSSGYSNMPTAEFNEPPHSVNAQSLSNMPTSRFDDTHPSLVGNPRVIGHHGSPNSSFRSHSSRRTNRAQMEQSPSSENLLDNVDRDSKLVGGRQTPALEFVADSFDTHSYTDVTKPHVVAT